MSPAARGAASPKMIGDDMLPNTTYEQVLTALVSRKSMAFLELTSLCNLGDHELRAIISWFEARGAVSVSGRHDIFEEVVTLREKGFAMAKDLARERELTLTASVA